MKLTGSISYSKIPNLFQLCTCVCAGLSDRCDRAPPEWDHHEGPLPTQLTFSEFGDSLPTVFFLLNIEILKSYCKSFNTHLYTKGRKFQIPVFCLSPGCACACERVCMCLSPSITPQFTADLIDDRIKFFLPPPC